MEDYVVVVATPGKGSEIITGLGYDFQSTVSKETMGETHLRRVIMVKLYRYGTLNESVGHKRGMRKKIPW